MFWTRHEECGCPANGITGILFAYIVFKEMIDAGRVLFFMKRVLTGILWCLAIGMVYSVLIRQSGLGERMGGISTVFNHRIKPTMEKSSFVVIDSGHGFFDAGKIGVGGTQEKEINL